METTKQQVWVLEDVNCPSLQGQINGALADVADTGGTVIDVTYAPTPYTDPSDGSTITTYTAMIRFIAGEASK